MFGRLLRAPVAPLWWPVRMAVAGLWVVAGVMLFFIAARLVAPDRNLLFIWVNAYTWWVYLPVYPIAAGALLLRRRGLLLACVAIGFFHALWVLPDYRQAEDIPEEARTAPSITVMTTNVFFENEDFGPIAEEILEVDADVVFVQEYGPGIEQALRGRGAEERFPHRHVVWENRFFGMAVYSKLPLIDPASAEAGGRPYIRTAVEVEGQTVVLYAVHPTSPGLGNGLSNHWNDAWSDITKLVDDEDLPVILAGDFNMTQHHRWYRQLKSDGMVSCHEERGRGDATTWPQTRKLRPIRLDHVFRSAGLVCLSVREGEGEGTDHEPVIAEIAVLGTS